MNDKILELAYLRNQLASRKFNEEDVKLLQKIENRISKYDNIFKKIAINAIENCKTDIQEEKFDDAVQELQLIHNFCFEKPDAWNSDYFYTVELLSYLEQMSDAKRIKETIALIGDLVKKIN